MILVQQNEKTLGPYKPSELKNLLILQRVRRSDLFSWDGASQWVSHESIKPFLELLSDDEVILYGERNLIVTQDRILTSTQMFLKEQIAEIAVVIPEASKQPSADFGRNVLWWLAVILFWTVVVPVAVMYINKKTPKEEGLGEVYGIQLRGSFGSELIKDGMGLLAADDTKRREMTEVCQILNDWKSGNLVIPSSQSKSEAEISCLPVSVSASSSSSS